MSRPTADQFPLSEPHYRAKRPRDFSPFIPILAAFSPDQAQSIEELLRGKTIPAIQELLTTGQLSAALLVSYYVDRIRRFDVDRFNSVLTLNPDAPRIAAALDRERAAGRIRGPLHGIPLLIKDNIATRDPMPTTAGAYALRNWYSDRDAFLVRRLRDAGAIILGKSNLSEWANFMDPSMPNGFSTLGGQTRHPYGPFDPSGSSSGSGVATAAGFAVAAIGTETQGSIISPSESNSIVGLKTSLGLVSRDRIVPLVDWMDVPGPMGRSVTDVALMLAVMAGRDAGDPATDAATALAGFDFTMVLDLEKARSLRVGAFVADDAAAQALLSQDDEGNLHTVIDVDVQSAAPMIDRGTPPTVVDGLRTLGIAVTEISLVHEPTPPPVLPVLEYAFKHLLGRFLADLSGQVPVASLAEVIAINDQDPTNRAPYGQTHLIASENSQISPVEFAEMAETNRRTSAEQIRNLLKKFEVDVLLTGSQLYAPAGFPALTVPGGYKASGQPFGVTIVGDYLAEPSILAVGYAIEQALQARKEPDLEQVFATYAGLHHAMPAASVD